MNFDILSPEAIPRSDMERLQDIKVVVCEARVPEESFWDEGKWIGEMFFAVVDGPMVYSDDRLAVRQ